jgi:hypothetical protein
MRLFRKEERERERERERQRERLFKGPKITIKKPILKN